MTTIPGVKYVEAYAEVKEKHGVKAKDWAIQTDPGFVRCSACPEVKISILKGKGSLTRHSETDKHKDSEGEWQKSTQLNV